MQPRRQHLYSPGGGLGHRSKLAGRERAQAIHRNVGIRASEGEVWGGSALWGEWVSSFAHRPYPSTTGGRCRASHSNQMEKRWRFS